ncbi:MAG: transglycosylase SLT domain-containing protein [Gammaproteobacteria bacterium]
MLTRRLGFRPLIIASAVVLGGIVATIHGCATAPPQQLDDVCAIFAEKNDWYFDALKTQQRWGTPVPVLMAIIRHESAFESDAKPPRKRFLWIFPGARPSTAYGYAQALDSTWDHYRDATGKRGADRDDFADAIDFIGWYNDQTYQKNGIAKTDAYNLYLAYHEGQGGYTQGSYQGKSWLKQYARQVALRADTYRNQLLGCESSLSRQNHGWWPLS